MSVAPGCRLVAAPAVCPAMPFPPSRFWDFSATLYARPGIAAACLRLQDRHGADVNLLLFAVWAAARGVTLDREAFRAAGQAVAGWQAAVVRPLRLLRRDLKMDPHGASPDLAEIVRDRIKAAELDAEHVEQLILAQRRPGASDEASPAIRGALARQNVKAYLELLGTDLDSGDMAAVDLVVAAV